MQPNWHRSSLARYHAVLICVCLGCPTADDTGASDGGMPTADEAGGSAASIDGTGDDGDSDDTGNNDDQAETGGPLPPADAPPSIEDMGLHEVSLGDTFEFEPAITGDIAVCRKDLGHDDVRVDSETGRIVWDTRGLTFGRGFYIRIKCSNYAGHAFASMVVHVDASGRSGIRVAGEDGVSPHLTAGLDMNSGDTIVFPDGEYPVSVREDESYENAFKERTPTAGSTTQFSTLIARTPGGVIVTGAAHDGIPKQKNAFQLLSPSYVAIVGMVARDVQRTSFSATQPDHFIADFVGSAGAGTEGQPCSNFVEAGVGACSRPGMRMAGGTPLVQQSYDWGHNRYGIMTNNSTGSLTRRSFVRVDEHRGDQPYGGFSDYCDEAHLSQDNTIFDTLAVGAPHYKNYAGLSAYPATGCENVPATLATSGLLAVNNDLSLSLMDQQAGPAHTWDHIVSYDSEGTCTPQTGLCGGWLLQADKVTAVTDSAFGKARGFEGTTRAGGVFGPDIQLGDDVIIWDVPGVADAGSPPRYLPESQLYFRGRSDTFYGDPGSDVPTDVRRWPIGGEDIIAAQMRSYHNPSALAVGGGTVDIDGNRGATREDESMSEYLWAYTDEDIPPLVVRVKAKDSYNRVAWEHLSSPARRARVTGWRVVCTETGDVVLGELDEHELVFHDTSGACDAYGVMAVYGETTSGIAYEERAR